MDANTYIFVQDISANLFAFVIACVPLILVIRAEWNRPWSVPGIIAAAALAVLNFFAQENIAAFITSSMMFCSLAYYVAERVTRKKS